MREMRQRCPQLWLEMTTHPWQYPSVGQNGARRVMRRLASRIEGMFYGEPSEESGYKCLKKQDRRKHKMEDCEACQLDRCPRVRNRSDPHKRKGRDGYNIFNLERIEWVLLDENDHAFHIT